MSAIKNIINASPEMNKADKNKEVKQARQKKSQEIAKTKGKPVSIDKAEISSAGRELLTLKAEAAAYLSKIQSAETLSAEEIEALRQKIAEGSYLSEELIDQMIDRILDLPGFGAKINND